MEEQCYALLIDADNVSAKYIKPILTELSKYGVITYKRIYGDWTSTHNSSWKEELLTNSIMPVQQFSYTQGKNATDSAMIIDAMDILYTSKSRWSPYSAKFSAICFHIAVYLGRKLSSSLVAGFIQSVSWWQFSITYIPLAIP